MKRRKIGKAPDIEMNPERMIVMAEIGGTIFRAVLGFSMLLVLTRMIGNKQMGQLNVFTYVSGIAVGAMAGGMVIYKNIEMMEAVIGIVVWGIMTILLEWITLKNRSLRKMMNGVPVIIIKGGKIQYRSLIKERLNLDDLTMMLRTNNIFSITDVDYAILEANGELSVLKRMEKETPTRSDLQLPSPEPVYLPTQLIADGRVIKNSLLETGYREEWLLEMLKKMDIQSVKDVMYAEVSGGGQLYVQKMDET